MKMLYRLLMAGTVLNIASMADAATMTSTTLESARGHAILLAQQQQPPEDQKKPAAPKQPAPQQQRPAPPPPAAAPPRPAAPPPPPVQHAPPPPVQHAPPPPVQHAPPPPVQNVQPPPPVQHAPPPPVQHVQPPPPPAVQAPVRPTPPAVQQAPVQTTPRPPAAQTAPRPLPPAPQGQPSGGAAQPTPQPPAATTPSNQQTPPTVQRAPNTIPPAVQGQPPVVVRPVTPPAGGAAVVPNTAAAPLQRSGVPAITVQQAQPIAPAKVGTGLAPTSTQGKPILHVDQLRTERRQTVEGNRTIIREPDRTIIREGNRTIIRHSEVDRFRYGARDVRLERRGADNATIVVRADGSRVVTVLDADGYLRRRSRFLPDGREIIIIEDRRAPGFRRGVGFGGFFIDLPPPVIRIPRDRYIVDYYDASPALLYDTLEAPPVDVIERPYSLDEVLYSEPLRARMPRIDLNTVTFDTGSWELTPEQIDKLAALADSINRVIERNPQEVFLIEGHTDAVGNDVDNLSLSDRRAESVAMVLTQQFNVPAENLTSQGYGSQYLKIPTPGPERANRRVTVRRITPLLTGQAQ